MEIPTEFTDAIGAGSTTIVTAIGAIMVLGLAIAGAVWGGKKVWKAFKGVTQ